MADRIDSFLIFDATKSRADDVVKKLLGTLTVFGGEEVQEIEFCAFVVQTAFLSRSTLALRAAKKIFGGGARGG